MVQGCRSPPRDARRWNAHRRPLCPGSGGGLSTADDNDGRRPRARACAEPSDDTGGELCPGPGYHAHAPHPVPPPRRRPGWRARLLRPTSSPRARPPRATVRRRVVPPRPRGDTGRAGCGVYDHDDAERFARALLMSADFDACDWLPDADLAERFVAPLDQVRVPTASAPVDARSHRGPTTPGREERARTGAARPSQATSIPRRRRTRRITSSLALALGRRSSRWRRPTLPARARAPRAPPSVTIVYVKRDGMALRGRPRTAVLGHRALAWKCFVYANVGQCTGTLNETYSTPARTYRPQNIAMGCGE